MRRYDQLGLENIGFLKGCKNKKQNRGGSLPVLLSRCQSQNISKGVQEKEKDYCPPFTSKSRHFSFPLFYFRTYSGINILV